MALPSLSLNAILQLLNCGSAFISIRMFLTSFTTAVVVSKSQSLKAGKLLPVTRRLNILPVNSQPVNFGELLFISTAPWNPPKSCVMPETIQLLKILAESTELSVIFIPFQKSDEGSWVKVIGFDSVPNALIFPLTVR